MTNEEFKEAMKNAPEDVRQAFGQEVMALKEKEYWEGNPGLMSITNAHTPGRMGASNYGRFKLDVQQGIKDGIADGSITNFKLDPRRNDPSFNPQFGGYTSRNVSDPSIGFSNTAINPNTGNPYQYGEALAPGHVENFDYGGRTAAIGDNAYDSRAGYANNRSDPNNMQTWTPQDWENYWNDGSYNTGMLQGQQMLVNPPMFGSSPQQEQRPGQSYVQTTATELGVSVEDLNSWADRNPNHPAAQQILSERSS